MYYYFTGEYSTEVMYNNLTEYLTMRLAVAFRAHQVVVDIRLAALQRSSLLRLAGIDLHGTERHGTR